MSSKGKGRGGKGGEEERRGSEEWVWRGGRKVREGGAGKETHMGGQSE